MNILELDSYNLSDAVKFNDKLNPKLWDATEHLKSEVREHLLKIADDFREFLGVPDLDLADITISGSNAAYTYTPNSDIDLHLVVNMPDDPVYRELFAAKKFQYNEQHNIKIGGADVELYVQDTGEPHISQGIYSILNNKWIQVPRRVKSVVDDTSTRGKFETVGHQIEQAVKSGDVGSMTRMVEKIKKMRQTGLEAHGEFGSENLAFKLLRNQGKIKELYDARNRAKDREMSLKEKAIKPQQRITYGFKTPTVVEDVGMSWDGVSPSTKMFLSETDSDEAVLKDFIEFCVKELKIETMPTIKLRKDPQWPVVHRTFGRYMNDKHTLEVAFGQRHIMDVLRTVAHELTHKHQHERDGEQMGPDAGETGSKWENEANARAGILMRDYGRLHPELFADGVIDIDEGYGVSTPAGEKIVKWQQDKITGKEFAIQGYRIKFTDKGLLIFKGADLVFKKPGDYSNPTNLDMNKARRYVTNLSNNWNPGPVVNEATGYIPTAAQAHDPRFEMALTKDVRPGALGKAANAFLLNTDSQGHPQELRPDGLVNRMMEELKYFKKKNKLAERVELDEVRMAPSNLMQWATSPEAKGVRAGFEAELIFRDTQRDDDEDYEMEPDYDQDERCRSISQVIDFFGGGDFGMGSRALERLQEQLDEAYMEWLDEQLVNDFKSEAEDLIRKVLVDEGDWDLDNEIQKQLALIDDLTDDQMNAIIQAGERAPKFTSSKEKVLYAEANPLYEKYLDAQEEAEDLLDELVQDHLTAQDGVYDSALDDFRDNYYIDDDSGFFDDAGLRYMSDIANNYDAEWPYMTGGNSGSGSRDWDSLKDSLENTIDMPVKVSSGYHNATRKEGLWIIEPDSSLQPDDSDDMGLEIVSPPMPLLMALEKLQAVTDWANSDTGNAYTNGSTGLHMGVSVPFKGGDVDYLKLILFLGDEYVLQKFGREANTYCKSAMSKFKENIKGGRADPAGALKLMQHGLLELAHKEIQKGVGDGKYTSAHIQNGYIEFRSPGGDWLAEESADPEVLQNTMLRFARAMSLAANPSEERREYAKKLYKLIAPEGDSEFALFSQFAAGELTAEQLKKRWAEKTIGTEKKMNQRWQLFQFDKIADQWLPVPGQSYNGYSEDEVKNRVWSKFGREALDSGEYELRNMSEDQQWEVYDVNTGETLEIVAGKNKGEVADKVYDKYAEQKIGFNVRPYEDPATMTPRAKLAKRITTKKPEPEKPAQSTNERGVPYWEVYELETGHVVHTLLSDDLPDAVTDAYNWLTSIGAEQPDLFKVRPKMNADTPVKDIAPDVAQNVGDDSMAAYERNSDRIDAIRAGQNATDRVGSWSIHDVTLGREISRMTDVPWQEASDRADMLERSTGHNMSVRGLQENFANGKGPGRAGDSQRHGIPKGATMAELEKAAKAPGRKGQLARWQLNMRRGHKK